ncbi:MAG: hypothetical protein OEW04_01260 [Nitrospirota bacterium]|nr:hypothetical protein [Nitrospirota bacterium]
MNRTETKKSLTDKQCSICGKRFPVAEFSYGRRDNRSYCKKCNKEEVAAYRQGGVEAARDYRERKGQNGRHLNYSVISSTPFCLTPETRDIKFHGGIIRGEVADVIIYLGRHADKIKIDIETSVEKIALNEQKYPFELAKDNAIKYNKRD